MGDLLLLKYFQTRFESPPVLKHDVPSCEGIPTESAKNHVRALKYCQNNLKAIIVQDIIDEY